MGPAEGIVLGDKPSITLEAPHDLDRVSAFLSVRVADIAAPFLKIRYYLRDPDGHLIEVGQSRR